MGVIGERKDTGQYDGWVDWAMAELEIEEGSGRCLYLVCYWDRAEAGKIAAGVSKKSLIGGSDPDDPDRWQAVYEEERYLGETLCEMQTGEDYGGPCAGYLAEGVRLLCETMREAGFLSEETFRVREEVWPWLSIAGISFARPTEEEEKKRIKKTYGLDPAMKPLPFDRTSDTDDLRRLGRRAAGTIVRTGDGVYYLLAVMGRRSNVRFYLDSPEGKKGKEIGDLFQQADGDPLGLAWETFEEWAAQKKRMSKQETEEGPGPEKDFTVELTKEEAVETRYQEYFLVLERYLRGDLLRVKGSKRHEVLPESRQKRYKERLSLETRLKKSAGSGDEDDEHVQSMRQRYELLKQLMPEKRYRAWKKDFLAAAAEKMRDWPFRKFAAGSEKGPTLLLDAPEPAGSASTIAIFEALEDMKIGLTEADRAKRTVTEKDIRNYAAEYADTL